LSKSLADVFLESYKEFELPEEISQEYTVMERLSENDIGETYLLSENSTGTRYVMKTYKKSEMTGRDNEAKLLNGLYHKGLPKLKAEIESNDTLFVMRDYIPGITLGQYIGERGVLASGIAVRVSLELCDILTFLHSQTEPIIHRDIKPSNIIINPEDNSVKLIDFGISRRYSKGAETDTVSFGTKKYAAPEQYGYKQTDGRSDLFSLGVVMRFMLTGSPDGQIVDGELKAITDKCTAFSPDERYQSVRLLMRALRKYRHSAMRRVLRFSAYTFVLCAALSAGFALGRYTEFLSIASLETPVEKTYVFAEPLIESAARLVLGKGEEEPLIQADLDNITQLYIDGTAIRQSRDDFFSMYNPNQFGNINSLEDLRAMRNLREVFIRGQSLTDISPLADCKMLEWIELPDCPVSDISPLTFLPRLRNLGLANTQVNDFSALAEINTLRYLFIYSPALTEISMLKAYQVKNLHLNSAAISTLDGIEGYTELEELSISRTGIQDFSPLNGIHTLKILEISGGMQTYLETLSRDDIQVNAVD
jgi:tRNA A-37 threonylcarbamoyl transferase component Bud32